MADTLPKNDPVDTAFAREELSARRLSLQVRIVLVIAIFIFLPFIVTPALVLPYHYGFSLLFVLSSWLHYRITKAGDRRLT